MTDGRKGRRIRRAIAVGIVATVILISGGQASADRPPEQTGTIQLPFPNPCTGEFELFTGHFTAKIIARGATAVIIVESEVSTSTGGEGIGHETQVFNPATSTSTINLVVDYPDGSKSKYTLLTEGDLFGDDAIRKFHAVCVQD